MIPDSAPSRLRRTLAAGSFLLGVFAFLIAAQPAALRAAIPQAAKDDPRYKLGYLVVTHYPGVTNDGTGDSLAGLQQAVDDAYANGLVTLFPSGTYVISDTLRCRDWHQRTSATALGPDPCISRAFILQGTSIGPRPVIKLADNPAKDFSNPRLPRPMLLYRLYQSTGYDTKLYPANGNAPMVDPPDTSPLGAPSGYAVNSDYLFNWEIRNLELDCSGKAGAIGVSFPATQRSLIYRVRVDATDAYAGFFQIPGANFGVLDVEVQGGKYGIVASPLIGSSGSSILGARLLDQTEAALVYYDFVPLTMAGFEIRKATAPAITVNNTIHLTTFALINSGLQDLTAWNTMSLLDGSVVLTGDSGTNPAISNPQGKNLYLHNVYFTGTTNLVKSANRNAQTGAGTTSRILEYSYTDQRSTTAGTLVQTITTRSLIDGVTGTQPERAVTIIPDLSGAPTDLIQRHLPAHGMPVYEGAGSPPTIVVTDPPYNADPGDTINDTAAIQQAIDDASAAGHGRVMIPKFNSAGTSSGEFLLTNTLTLRANTVLFGAAKGFVSELRTHSTWRPTAATDILRTVDDASASTYLGNLSIKADVTLLWYPFTFFHWRAGRASETFDVRASMPWIGNEWPVNTPRYPAYTAFRFSGHAGGRHFYSPSGNMDTRYTYPYGADNRTVRIEGTHEPLWLYGWNLETSNTQTPKDQRRYDVEITGARNIRWLGWKQEGSSPMLHLDGVVNFALHGGGSMRYYPPPGTGLIEITGASDNLLMTNLLVQSDEGTNSAGALLSEAIAGQVANAIPYPEGVSLYQRGTLDDAAMRLPSPGDDAPAIAAGPAAQTVVAGEALVLSVTATGAAPLSYQWLRNGFAIPGANAATLAMPCGQAFQAGAYAVVVSNPFGSITSPSAMVTVNPAPPSPARILNLSIRGHVSTNSGALIAGFVISPGGARSVLVRAVGPGLGAFGVEGVLADPRFHLFRQSPDAPLIAANDNWGENGDARATAQAAAAVGAFPLSSGSADAALLVTLPPGAYTVHVSGVGGRTGVALIELYEVP